MQAKFEDPRAQLEAEVERLGAEIESKSANASAISPPAKKQSRSWTMLPWPLSRLIPGNSASNEGQASWDSSDELTTLQNRLKAKESELAAMQAFPDLRKAMEAEIKVAEKDIARHGHRHGLHGLDGRVDSHGSRPSDQHHQLR